MTGDEERIVGLLRRLDAEPVRPARVDLAAAMHEGRRRRRSRRAMSVSAAGVAVLAAVTVPLAFGGERSGGPAPTIPPAAPSTPAGPPATTRPPGGPTACTAEALPIPGGHAKSLVTGGDPTGRFLAGRSYPGDGTGNPVIIWDGDRAREYRIPGADQQMADVNSAGVAVGSVYVGDEPQPYVIRNGRPERLRGVPAGEATAITDGWIVGARQVGDRQRPVLWSAPDASARDLPLPGSRWEGTAVGVDSAGTAVGKLHDGPTGVTRAVVWRLGAKPELLPMPRLDGGVASEFVPDSFEGGWITGTAFLDESGVRRLYAARYHLPTGRYEPLPRGVVPDAGNGRGWVVGSVSRMDAGLLTDAGTVRLPDFDGRTGRYAALAVSVSDDGRVVGGQLDVAPGGNGVVMKAVRWRCH
ncbi:hypothetical protein [Micromonospora sp. WMMD812]|uniref:hypothetical protein n=1 Tax=Micromonospora sp. WMMD812 TaxID=3015152 RepID=UPI00248C2622|nr:hypothetical protein [Micromonospora sp. WMMD812]WBB66671.1 hypothetical protein O7603_26550 [Micromonospora sp. WMMD812]